MSIVSLAKLNLRFNNRIAEIIQNILFSFTLLLQTMFYCVFLQSHGCNMGGKCGNRTEDEENENTIEWIVPNAQKNQMEPILLKLEPGGSTDPDNPHEGEEFGYVLNGAVTIHLGNKVYRAKKGETFYYVSGKQHYLTSKVGATVLWISSPPTF